jgi:small subunit ribosomal protein S16
MGSKKRPYFRVVVTEARTPRDSRFVEILGQYDPRSRPAVVKIDRERFRHWIAAGARASDTVRTLVAGMPPEPAAEPSPAAAPEGASA